MTLDPAVEPNAVGGRILAEFVTWRRRDTCPLAAPVLVTSNLALRSPTSYEPQHRTHTLHEDISHTTAHAHTDKPMAMPTDTHSLFATETGLTEGYTLGC